MAAVTDGHGLTKSDRINQVHVSDAQRYFLSRAAVKSDCLTCRIPLEFRSAVNLSRIDQTVWSEWAATAP